MQQCLTLLAQPNVALSGDVCLAAPSLSSSVDAHGGTWHEGVSCREEPEKTGCEAGGVSEHVAPLSHSTKRTPCKGGPHHAHLIALLANGLQE